MSQMNPPETARTYGPPSVRQFSVFLENRVGRLADMVRIFDETPNVRLCGLSIQESSDFGVVRIIPSNGRIAEDLLRSRGLSYASTDLLIVELQPEQTLSGMCLCLLGAELSIRFAYPLMACGFAGRMIALSVDDHVLAGQILRKKRFRLLAEADLEMPDGD